MSEACSTHKELEKHRILVGKQETTIPWCRWKDHIQMNRTFVWFEGMDLGNMTHDWDGWKAVAFEPSCSRNTGCFLTS
jgi:hypothetical protein